MSAPNIAAEGITNPPIDELLAKSDCKYKLVLFGAKRARQINAYYSQLGEGLLDYVGPLVETHVQEKPLSIALREVNAGLLTCIDIDPDARCRGGRRQGSRAAVAAGPPRSRSGAPPSRLPGPLLTSPADPSDPGAAVVLGVAGGIAAYKACELLRRLTESGHDVTVVPTAAALEFVGAADLGRAVRQAGAHRGVRRRRTRCRTSGSARRPTWSWSRRRPPTCWPGPRTAGPTTC